MEGNNSIKSMEMALIIFIAQTGVSTIMLPSTLAKEAGHDAWITLLITGAIVILLSIFLFALMRRYQDKNIYDINMLIFGKVVGTVLNSILVFYLLTTVIGGVSLFTYFIRITLLQRTPYWVLAPFITLPTFYLVWQGLKAMSRFLFCSIINYLAIIFVLIFIYKEIRLTFLLPIGEAGIFNILLCVKKSFFAFIGFELFAFFYPYITDKPKAINWYLGANISSMFFFIIIYLSTTTVFGENFLRDLTMPFYNLSRIYNAPILERVDLYLIALWFIPMACSMRNYVFAAYDGLQKIFKLKKTRVTYILYFLIILILSSIPKDFNQVLILADIINIMGAVLSIHLFLCLLLSFIRKRGVYTK